MPIPAIQIECDELSDDDLEGLNATLQALPGVKSVGITLIFDANDPGDAPDDQPMILGVSLTVQQWNRITRGATGTDALGLAGEWIADQLQTWCESQDLSARYDPEFNFVTVQV